jgi:hypothetical protein
MAAQQLRKGSPPPDKRPPSRQIIEVAIVSCPTQWGSKRVAKLLYRERGRIATPRTRSRPADPNLDQGSAVTHYYFFNVKNHVNMHDEVGTELANLEAARTEALKDIVDIKNSQSEALDSHWPEWSIEICDDEGDVLLVVPFSRN